MRDSLREKARISGEEDDWTIYKKSRNDVTRDTKKTKDDYFAKLYDNMLEENDTRRIFSTTKELLGWNTDISPRELPDSRETGYEASGSGKCPARLLREES